MKRAYRGVFVVLALCAACLVFVVPVIASPTRQDTGGSFGRLLSFVPAPATPKELVDIWINYGDPAAVKRLHSYSYTHFGEIPALARGADADLSPDQLRVRRWSFDLSAMQLPSASGLSHAARWREPFGYDLYSIERALGAGQPPSDYGVIELDTDTALVAERLTAWGYEQEPAPHGFVGTLYRRHGDGDQVAGELVSDLTVGGMNRVVIGPGLLVAGRATSLVSDALAANTGAVPSAMTVPAIAQIVGAVEDPNMLPGTTLIGGSVLGLARAPLAGSPVDILVQAQSPEEARRAMEAATQAADAMPFLPPYILHALAYRRGADQAERFQTITLLYPDEAVARAAGAALTTRIAAYRNVRDGKPMLGEDVVEQLETVIRSGEGGTTVTARLRLSPDHQNLFYQRLYNRDLGFLAPGGS